MGANVHWLRARPQSVLVERGGKLGRSQGPVKLNDLPVVAGIGPLIQACEETERRWRRLVTKGADQSLGSRQVGAAHEEIEVATRTQAEVSVGEHGEGWSFEREHRNAGGRQTVDNCDEIAGESQAAVPARAGFVMEAL